MSSAVEFVVAPSFLPALLPTLAAAAAAAGTGVAVYAAYKLIDQLHKDYEAGLAEFHAKADADADVRLLQELQQRELADSACALIEQTRVSAVLDANRTFLLKRVTELIDSITPLPDPALLAQCNILRADIMQSSDRLEAQLDTLRHLAEAADTLAESVRPLSPYDAQMSALREEINSPLLDTADAGEIRRQLLAQLESLEQLAARQHTVVKQGLSLLRQRVYRELHAQAQLQQTRTRQVEKRRRVAGDLYAKLQAVSRRTELPEFVAGAEVLRKRMADVLSTGGSREFELLNGLLLEAETLFAACERALQERLVASVISDQVTGALLSMGYQVRQVDGEENGHLLAAIDNGVGLEFRVDGEGHVGSEMVALTPDGTHADHKTQEHVCTVIDQVVSQLVARNYTVRERCRSSLHPGEQLRVVDILAGEEPIVPISVEPKHKKVNEP